MTLGMQAFYSVLVHSKSTAQGPPSREGLGCMVPTLFHWELEKLEKNIFKRHRRPTRAVGPRLGGKTPRMMTSPVLGISLPFPRGVCWFWNTIGCARLWFQKLATFPVLHIVPEPCYTPIKRWSRFPLEIGWGRPMWPPCQTEYDRCDPVWLPKLG